MTEFELEQYVKTKYEVEYLERRLDQLRAGKPCYPSQQMTGMPTGSGGNKDLVSQVALSHEQRREEEPIIVDLLEKSLVKLEVELKRTAAYIHSVPHADIRLAMRMKYMDGMSWTEIGLAMNCDRSGISKKVREYIKFPTIPAK